MFWDAVAHAQDLLNDDWRIRGRLAARELELHAPLLHIRADSLRCRVTIHPRNGIRIPPEHGKDRQNVAARATRPSPNRQLGIGADDQIERDQSCAKNLRAMWLRRYHGAGFLFHSSIGPDCDQTRFFSQKQNKTEDIQLADSS